MIRRIMPPVRVVVVFLIWVTACTPNTVTSSPPTPPTNTPTDTPPAPTDTPTPTDTLGPPTDTPTATDTPSPSDVDLATEYSVFYALPDTGLAYLLTPRRASLGITAEELAANPDALENQVLGRLRVAQQLNEQFPLPPGDYTMTLGAGAETLVFNGPGGAAEVPAIIRSLQFRLPRLRPVAMISSEEMCLASDTLQICGLVPTPLRADLQEQLAAAIQELGADPNVFALDSAVPDVEGDNMQDLCFAELSKEDPNYTECRATVLAAPVLQGLEPPPVAPDAISIGVLLVLEDLVRRNDIFGDPELTDLLGKMPPAGFLAYRIVLETDDVLGTYGEQRITASRVGLSPGVGKDPAFYLRAVIGAPLIGEAIQGAPPPEGPQAVISNLLIKDWNGNVISCIFGECPDYSQ